MDINMDQVTSVLEDNASQAENMLNDPAQVDGILVQLEEKLKEVPGVGEPISNLMLMIDMVKGYVTKQYDKVSPKVVALMLGSFIYFVKKDDLLPDQIPLLGAADDLLVLGLALKLSEDELKEFREQEPEDWRVDKLSQILLGKPYERLFNYLINNEV